MNAKLTVLFSALIMAPSDLFLLMTEIQSTQIKRLGIHLCNINQGEKAP
jgi:hypothetical protein